jgi:hypothetical protein
MKNSTKTIKWCVWKIKGKEKSNRWKFTREMERIELSGSKSDGTKYHLSNHLTTLPKIIKKIIRSRRKKRVGWHVAYQAEHAITHISFLPYIFPKLKIITHDLLVAPRDIFRNGVMELKSTKMPKWQT